MKILRSFFVASIAIALLGSFALGQGAMGASGGTQGPVIVSGPPATCFVGVPYTFTAQAQGGVQPYTWSTSPSSPVPGLGAINSSTGVLGGNGASCTTPGNYTFTLTVVDANGSQASTTFTIPVSNALQITPIANPQGDVSVVYTTSTPQATGGTPPYTWSCPTCPNPPIPGLFSPINPTTGVIGPGSPTQQGTYNLTIMVKDAAGLTATANDQIIINPSVFFTSNGPPSPVTVNVPYPTFCLAAQGGSGTITYGLVPPAVLPNGLNLNSSTGCITGTPNTVQTIFNIFFSATDTLGSQAIAGGFTIVVQSSTPTLQFNNVPCGPGRVNVPYTCQLSLTGGTGTGYAYSLFSGANPPNTSLNGTTGLISGTPLSATTVTPTYLGTDSGAHTAQQAEMITISPTNGCGPPLYSCSSSSTAVIQAPAPPFSTNVGQNQIRYDASINGPGTGLTGIDPIVRATDSTTGGTGFTIDISGGADDNIFSLNDTKIALIPQNTGGICVMAFNASTLQVSNPCTSIPNTHSMTWSLINDNVMYGLSSNSPKVWKTTFTSPTTFTQAVLVDPTVACANLIPPGTYTGGSVSLSGDESIVYGAIVTNQQNSVGYVFAYNQNTQQCSALSTNTGQVLLFNGTVTASTMPCVPIGLHNSGIFLNGTWSRMSTGTIGSCAMMPQYWQIGTTNVFACVCSCGTGHNSNEWNLEVQISNPTFHWANINSATYCSDLAAQTYGSALWLSNGQGGDVEVHFGVTHVSSNNTEPEFGGTALVNQNAPWVAPVINEMWAMQRSPIKFTRFVHTFNSSQTNCPTCDFRDYEVIVAQSQSGKFGAFCSDMLLGLGTSSNGPRIDVFIVRLD